MVLLIAGAQLPAIPFIDVVGRVKEPPAQMGGICVKVGVWLGLTVIVIV